MTDEKKSRKRQAKPETVNLVSIHSDNPRYRCLVAICDDLSNAKELIRTRGRGQANKKILATSEFGWKTQIRKLLVERYVPGTKLVFNDGKRLGSFWGKISGVYEMPYERYSKHRELVALRKKASEFIAVSGEIVESGLITDTAIRNYLMELMVDLDHGAVDSTKEADEANFDPGADGLAKMMTTVAGNEALINTVSGFFLGRLGDGAGIDSINYVLSRVRERADSAREEGKLAINAALQTALRSLDDRIDRVYGANIRDFRPVKTSYV